MVQLLLEIDEVKQRIEKGEILLLAGDEGLLNQLPKGNWIGGTIPYFMAEQGGVSTKEKIFLTELPDYIKEISIKKYTIDTISQVYTDDGEMSLSFIIIPASSEIHLHFALNAHTFENFATRPLVGWISGVHLDDLGKISAKVFNGMTKEMLDNSAIVMHVKLPDNKYPELNIVNIFKQGEGDIITFLEDGFSAVDAIVNGEKVNFAEYLKTNDVNIQFPLVANYVGAMINTSFQAINEEEKRVDFYAPVFQGIEYKLAKPVDDYITEFTQEIPREKGSKIAFSCNCILNYLYSELEGKHTGVVTGPITFGEIAYQLLNQTLAYLIIQDL